ncbi:peptide chain release factor N(5)-glutamine methyltransferase [Frankia sp. B2]|uniref:peptide chain release factor N(5)-glutamine methyltransferase n=1 Tax=Frankia sp. B2 TaxID=2541730 RepID=UPI00106BE60C|nr:peptide chain release factor N(5)-glutamine methyltransferase [Frankia sp. B2]TFE29254.1 peptide chain release factor N(5)-glutamine methyltransferase [Frankia sp. B2]
MTGPPAAQGRSRGTEQEQPGRGASPHPGSTDPLSPVRHAADLTPLGAWLAAATDRLRAAGVASPRADAEQLAAFVLAVPRGRLALLDDVTAAAARRLDELVARRAQRVPLQHLTGVAGFRHLDLTVGPGVFIPRPETESVVEWALTELTGSAGARRPGPLCVDLCAGSGAIALSLAAELPGATVHAVEVDPAAVVWLRRNIAGTGFPVTAHAADIAAALPESLTRLAGTVDLIISNPPYLPDADRHTVEPEVGEHDPARALWGGPDGLDVVRTVVGVAARLLRPGGLLVIEHADGHGVSAPELLRADGRWSHVADYRDLAGRDRFVAGRRGASREPRS